MPPKRARRSSNRHQDRQVNIPSLPNQVIHHILSYLTSYNQGTLAACCLVSRQFDAIARTLLWRRIRISPPARPAPRPTVSRSIHEDSQNKPLDISHWREQSRNLVQFLSVSNHDDTWCHFSHPRQLDLPNLKVLELDAKRNTFTAWPSSVIHTWLSDDQNCLLLKGLRPKVAIIRKIGQEPFKTQWRGVPLRTWSEVITLVMISSSINPREHHSYRCPIPGFINLQKVIWVYDPQAFRSTPSGSPSKPLMRSDTSISIGDFLLLHLLERFVDVPIMIVNLGSSARYRLCTPILPEIGDGDITSEDIFRHNLTHRVKSTNVITRIRKED